jgi:ferredoxin
MVYHVITIEDTGETYKCDERLSVLEGMENLGKKGIPVGCRGGGCGVCKIEVVGGEYKKRIMSRDHVTVEEEAQGIVLACRVKPTGPMTVRVLGKMKKNVCKVESSDKQPAEV